MNPMSPPRASRDAAATARTPATAVAVAACATRPQTASSRATPWSQCWSVTAPPIDERVAACVLEAVTPEVLALGLIVSEEAASQVATLDRQWSLRVERARYEARLAERRYKAVDPANRTVAQALEHEREGAQSRAALCREEGAMGEDVGARLLSIPRHPLAASDADVAPAADPAPTRVVLDPWRRASRARRPLDRPLLDQAGLAGECRGRRQGPPTLVPPRPRNAGAAVPAPCRPRWPAWSRPVASTLSLHRIRTAPTT